MVLELDSRRWNESMSDTTSHEHRFRHLAEYRGGFDLFYCEACLEYRAVKRDDQPAVRDLDGAPSAPRDVLTRVVLGQHPEDQRE